MILPSVRDPRLITVHRGGLLSDADHRSLALWAAECASHVLGLFEGVEPSDSRPRDAIDATHAWVRGELAMMATRALGGHSMGAARPLRGAARFAAYAAGQAACVAHVPEHDLGAAAYAIKAVRAAAPAGAEGVAGRRELEWQRDRLPSSVRELVLEDQKRRNSICWYVFEDRHAGSSRVQVAGISPRPARGHRRW
ncbi:putative uncharacterized protein [Rhodococcus sp. AW25M09]|uniref:putative immunity protein n=1 Tax=unclassified Rhodococcus (in: high G+C Gram-positive bacteria) TaxID=192944 RepID=UPI0002AC0ED5|nr:hypothetical protein [Rhodococcus sp. AW25M09]CCQ17039.1 putative uncharacterized protein [Rhodococcus sp. AW25M09]